MTEPKTFAERLDAAQDGQEFGAVIDDMFKALQSAHARLDGMIDRAAAALKEVEAEMGGDDE